MCVTNNLRTALKLKDTFLLIHIMNPNLCVMFVSMVVRIKKAWMYILEPYHLTGQNQSVVKQISSYKTIESIILEGITLINLNVVYVTLRQEVKKS